jgi:serine protease Do
VSMFEDIQQAAGHVLKVVAPAVVRIGGGPGRGAGLVVAEGTVVTNAHNIRGPQTTVTFSGGRTAQGVIQGVDPDEDLAVIQVDTTGVTPVAIADESPALPVGAAVFAVGPTWGGGVRVTFGTVSGVGRSFRGPRGRLIGNAVEHTAALGRGSSGGPVVDAAGRLLGLNTHRLGEGFYLAVLAGPTLRQRVESLARGESPERIRLGVALAPSHAARRMRAAVGLPERDGLLIVGVEEDSPASRAGLSRGDLIVGAGEVVVTTVDELFNALEGRDASGAGLTLRIVRGAEELEVLIDLTAPAAEGSA